MTSSGQTAPEKLSLRARGHRCKVILPAGDDPRSRGSPGTYGETRNDQGVSPAKRGRTAPELERSGQAGGRASPGPALAAYEIKAGDAWTPRKHKSRTCLLLKCCEQVQEASLGNWGTQGAAQSHWTQGIWVQKWQLGRVTCSQPFQRLVGAAGSIPRAAV